MPKFALIYRNSTPPASPEEGSKHMDAWRAWSSGLGDALVEPGMPFSTAKVVSNKGVSDDLGGQKYDGISIVEARDIDEAMAMAARCPHLDMGGDMVVAEGLDMEM